MSQRKKRLIPFSWTPASWGLRGPQREEAEAAYYLDGYDLDIEIAKIRNKHDQESLNKALAHIDCKHGRITEFDRDMRLLHASPTRTIDVKALAESMIWLEFEHGRIDEYARDQQLLRIDLEEAEATEDARAAARLSLDLKHGKITQKDFDLKVINLDYPDEGVERDLALLDVKLKHHEISEFDYEKERATLLEEPWIGIVNQGLDPDKGINGIYFEFDWNEYMILYLRMNGYQGSDDVQVVERWFRDVCRAQAMANADNPNETTVIPFAGRAVNRSPDE